ncbi:DNA repair protein RadA, partial [Actinotignum timonense]|nr:DNA repair protein RadA [Actinotignum timonense]
MAKQPATVYECSECGWSTGKWMGRCARCGSWGTLDQHSPAAPSAAPAALA